MSEPNDSGPSGEVPPDAFVSYSHKDKEWVRELVAKLNGDSVGSRHLQVVMDETALVPGESLMESLEKGVRRARRLICVLSPDFVASDWTSLEYQIKMLDDPAGRKGLIIPILYRDCDVPYTLKLRIGADFRRKESYDHAYRRLLVALGVRGVPPSAVSQPQRTAGTIESSGYQLVASQADPVRETLALNAFEVVRSPELVRYADTAYATPKEVVQAVGGKTREAFVLHSGRLWTFTPLDSRSSPLRTAIDKESIERTRFRELLASSGTRSMAIELLNRSLSFHFLRSGILYDGRYGRYYFPAFLGGARKVPWPGLKKSTERTVTVPVLRHGHVEYFKHLAAVMNFRFVGGRLCLQVLPVRAVTEDGHRPMRGPRVGPLVGKMTRRIYNNAFWLDVMFWLHQLHFKGQILVGRGDSEIEISPVPLNADTMEGIFEDHLSMFSPDYMDRWSSQAPPLEEEDEDLDEEEGEEGVE